jgi:SAM-dependent methyltransferase
MSSEAIPVTRPCNICGNTEFELGPSSRLSISKRPPLCVRCRSLERHRIVRAMFDSFPQELLAGTRCLQFSPDPALDPARFEEILVSVWGGANSLDMQAIALADGSYQWVYSSHVINHVPDAAAALREMLRVVGDGTIVLSVGGTVFNYATADSERVFGPDRQFKLYGTLYADEVQRVLPQVAVLELVGLDPCSVSLDAVYFVSKNAQRLTRMAEAAVAHNVHARVFPAKQGAAPDVFVAAERKPDAWETLHDEIVQWRETGSPAELWVRDDDVTSREPRLVELVDLCERENVALTLAVIPLPMGLDVIEMLSSRSNLIPIQHGFDHQNREHEAEQAKSEFPASRSATEVLRSVALGHYVMTEAFGDRFLPVFCPPWGTMAPQFRERLKDLGFVGYSGSRIQSEIYRQGTSPSNLRLAGAHVAVNRGKRTESGPFAEERILQTLAASIRAIRQDRSSEPVGIMTHHWGVDEQVRHFLTRLFRATRAAGATWVGAQHLFGTTPAGDGLRPGQNEVASQPLETAQA